MSDLQTFETDRIMELLPHRYPFLLVDRILDVDGDTSARGIKNVTANEPQFTGHFPGNPIMPGVLIVEGMAQTAGAICAAAHEDAASNTVYFMTIDQARFRKPVRPGDTLEYVISKKAQKRNIFKFTCVANVGGTKVAEAIISAMMVADDG